MLLLPQFIPDYQAIIRKIFSQKHIGTSLEETVIIQSPLPFLILLSVFLVNRYHRRVCLEEEDWENSLCKCFLFEFLILVVTQIFMFTLPSLNYFIYFIVYAACIYIIGKVSLDYFRLSKKEKICLRRRVVEGKRSFVTYFRASVNLTTTICILAVDFNAFPRYLAKTDTYGFSLMDTGVGYFVVCNALVTQHQYKGDNKEGASFIFNQIKQNSILIFLGVLRCVLVKCVGYQNPITEYGVHWNFFLTLAFVRFFSTFLLTRFAKNDVKYLSLCVIVVHQLILAIGVEDWVMSDASRDNLLSANREGIVSLLGYIGLYLMAVEIRHRFVAKRSSLESDVKTFLSAISLSVLLYFLVVVLNMGLPCSRRIVNVTYIAWILMLSMYLLSLSMVVEIFLRISDGFETKESCHVPSILESINLNGMPYFLCANVLTGFVNLCVTPMYLNAFNCILILTLYMILLCFIFKTCTSVK